MSVKSTNAGITACKRKVAMSTIVYVGLDVHKEKIQACSFIPGYGIKPDLVFANDTLSGDYQVAGKYLAGLRRHFGKDARFVCGYEAGCLGFSLCRELSGKFGVECHVMAPSTMSQEPGSRIKTDRRDAEKIAKCLSSNAYKEVRMLDREDESVRDYIRMRDDFKQVQKELKQKILAMLLRRGVRCDTCKVPWTKKFMAWLGSADMGGALAREAMDEYVSGLERVNEKLEKLDRRILELSGAPRYRDNVRKLVCLPGIKEHTALALCCEVGDFSRFKSPKDLAAFLGLVPGERSSGDKTRRTGLTKAGNSHLRRLLTEAAQGALRSKPSYKSKALKARQAGAPEAVVAYADRARARFTGKYRRMASGERLGPGLDFLEARKPYNVVVGAVARELACFACGMVNGLYEGAESADFKD